MNRRGFVVSAVLYPLLVLFLALIMGLISMSSTRKTILDNMKMEISDSTFEETECSCETILNKLNYIIEKGIGGGVRNIINLNIKSYSSATKDTLPKEYTNKNDIAIVSSVEVNGYYIQDYEPVNPVNGSVWVKIRQGSGTTISNDKVKIPIAQLEQYQNGSWVNVTAYIYKDSEWITVRSSDITTATVDDIAKGKTAIINGKKVTGTNSQTSEFPEKSFATDAFLYEDNKSIRAILTTDNYSSATQDTLANWHDGSAWKSLSSASGTITCNEGNNCSNVANFTYGNTCTTSTSCIGYAACIGCAAGTNSAKINALIDNNVYCYGTECTDTRVNKSTTWQLELSNSQNFYKAGKIVITLINHNNTDATVAASGVESFYTRVPAGYSKVDSAGKYESSYYSLVPEVTIIKDTDSWNVKSVISNVDYDTLQEKFNHSTYEDTNTNANIVQYAYMWDQSLNYKNGFSAEYKNNKLSLNYSAIYATYNEKYKTVRGYRQNDAGLTLESNWLESDSSSNYGSLDCNAAGTWCYYYVTAVNSGITYANSRYRLQARYPYWDVMVHYYK